MPPARVDRDVDRRALLGSLATGLAGLTGCLQRPLDAGGQPPGTTTPAWGSEPPCPSFDPAADRRVCTGGGHAKPDEPLVALRPPAGTPVRAGKSVVLTLRPDGELPVTVATGGWLLRRYDDGEWTAVADGPGSGRYATVYPDERYDWVVDGSTATADGTQVPVALDPGSYAFAVTASVGRGWTYGDRIECVALFSVVEA